MFQFNLTLVPSNSVCHRCQIHETGVSFPACSTGVPCPNKTPSAPATQTPGKKGMKSSGNCR